MPIRGRVGRHANTGRHCQNWKDDQTVVINLLNKISVDSGGAGGGLGGRIVAGLASEPLYKSILRFQKTHYPTQSGFVEPGSKMLNWMEILSTPQAPPPRPTPPAPKPAGQWSALTTGSVKRAVTAALDDNKEISHAEVVNIIRSTLSDGIISHEEVKDLETVSAKARSISSQSRRMLDMLVAKIRKSPLSKGPYELALEKHRFAAGMACDFLERPGATRFPYLDRMDVGTGLLMRIANPGLLNQDKATLCGPAAVLFNVAYDNPVAYARFAIDLFEKGKAKIGRWVIEPSSDLRSYRPPESIDHVDWMMMASMRDDENFLRDHDEISDDGGTYGHELAKWFSRAGYVDVREKTTKSHSSAATIDELNQLFSQGYRIILFINSNMLREKDQSTEGRPNHFVVQRSPIDRSGGKVRLKVFTWGSGDHEIPNGKTDLSVDDFLENLYGYVAAKPY